ncbi:hypothetical protein A2U01_0076634 [Trifolium medium]|uniref:Uncharacterized protein n=1 Tax=Trifolium medium TaxID=97028 RepID=A0A392T4E7_9FABA|nr:hypothetical protein [Trifolium medium]
MVGNLTPDRLRTHVGQDSLVSSRKGDLSLPVKKCTMGESRGKNEPRRGDPRRQLVETSAQGIPRILDILHPPTLPRGVTIT